jgi:hypothetical protein
VKLIPKSKRVFKKKIEKLFKFDTNLKVLIGTSRLFLNMHFIENCILRSPNTPCIFQRGSFTLNFKSSIQRVLQILK